jgi:signal transduction histidine kinase/CheY-like chemotaxis protein
MEQPHKHGNISRNVALGYFFLVVLAAGAIFILYQGIQQVVSLDPKDTAPNSKIKEINKILSLIYETESYARTYAISKQGDDFEAYVVSSGKIEKQINSLKTICKDNPSQINSLNEISNLLTEKKSIVRKLAEFDHDHQKEIILQRAIDEVSVKTYDAYNKPSIVRQKTVIKRDSVINKEKKSGFFTRLKNLFGGTPAPNKVNKVTVEEATHYDTIIPYSPKPETVVNTVKDALDKIRNREEDLNQLALINENNLLHSDRAILNRVREMVASLESEELLHTSRTLARTQQIVRKSTYTVILLSGAAMLLLVVFLILILRDISRGKAYQKALEDAEEQARTLLKLKEQFVANTSHEIRTPLTAIIGYTEELKNIVHEPVQQRFVQHIETATSHLHTLVNQVLDLSKSQAGKLILEEKPFSIPVLLEEVTVTFAAQAKQKNIALHFSCQQELGVAVLGDAFRLRQVLLNITGNALKFTEKGSVSLSAEMISEGENTLQFELKITDTGIGIPEDKLETIFEEFSQAESGTTRQYGGTGLGLAIARNIITAMGGQINVISETGKGSTFCIRLSLPVAGETEQASADETDAPLIPERVKILLVEDDEPIRFLFGRILERHSIEAVFAQSGEEALRLLEKHNTDLIFTDIQMPGMSGFDLVKKIHESKPQLPVIAFSARRMSDDECRTNGFAAYMPKPFTEQLLLHTIAQIVNPLYAGTITEKPESAPDSHALFSFAGLEQFVGDDPEALKEIINSFIKQAQGELPVIRTSIETKDWPVVSAKVHKLLPMFRQLQINSVVENMQILERYRDLEVEDADMELLASFFIEKAEEIVKQIEEKIGEL